MATLKFSKVVYFWVLAAVEECKNGVLSNFMKRVLCIASTFLLATGGAILGTVVGAMKGQTTETGFLHGSMIGAVSGAITAVQLRETTVVSFGRLMNQKIFMEWMTTLETSYREISDAYDASGAKGLSRNSIRQLPEFYLVPLEMMTHQSTCPICIRGWKEGELARKLPNCGHLFHLICIDQWLLRRGSCPVCRNIILSDDI